MVIDGNDFRGKLKTACRLYGGIKAVAKSAGVDNANLGKWLKGGLTLSEKNVAKVLAVLGLPNGVPDVTKVHLWTHENAFSKLAPAFELYFPHGAEIACAHWSSKGMKSKIYKLERISKNDWVPEVYAITDGQTRAVLRHPTGLLIQLKQMGNVLRWKNGSDKESYLQIADKDRSTWLEDTPTIDQFDQVWNALDTAMSEEDVLRAIKDEGISFQEAIARIRHSR